MIGKMYLMVGGGFVVGASAAFIDLSFQGYFPYPWHWATLSCGFFMVGYGVYATARDEKASS